MSPSLSADCGGPYDLKPEHTITCWEDKSTSPAESAIIDYLVANPALVQGKRLLHVGIGNSALPLALIHLLPAYVGITISVPATVEHERVVTPEQARAIDAQLQIGSAFARLGGVPKILHGAGCIEQRPIQFPILKNRGIVVGPGAVVASKEPGKRERGKLIL